MQISGLPGPVPAPASRGWTGAPGRNRVVGTLIETTFLGGASQHVLLVNGQRITVISVPPLFDVPAEVAVEFDADAVVLLAE